MKISTLSAISLFAIFAISSCTKVITLDLDDTDRKIVVDGMVSNLPEYNFIKLTQSDNFYQTNNFENVTGALVTITDPAGTDFVLAETTPGYYSNPLLVGQSNSSYSLRIEANGEVITGNTFVPSTPIIDSIVTQESNGGFFGDGYVAFLYWQDNIAEKNYYRLRTFENGVKEDIIYVSEDALYNGLGTGQPLFTNSYEFGDTAVVELMAIDPGTYEYWFSLSQISDPQNQPAAPGNPETNLQGNALGYFGGYNIARQGKKVE